MFLKTNLRGVIVLTVWSALYFVYVCGDSGYSHDSGVGKNHQNWMKAVKDNTPLKKISMPGTHDSLAFYGGDAVQTQSKSLDEQLRSGIRVFDVRCRHFHDEFPIHHGFVFQNTYFKTVLDTMNRFLDSNPSEVLLMRLKEEHTAAENHLSFEEEVKHHIKLFGRRIWVPNNNELTIGKVRGKIVILQDFPASAMYGIKYDSFNIQDNYHLNTNWDLYSKWESVRNQLINANNNNGKNYFMNYLSASGGSFPYFVVSGHSSPGTNAPRLLTGRTTPGWKDSYPDFPRVSCFIGICSIAFEGTDILTKNYITSHKLSFVGIIMTDFPGDALIEAIINLNFH